MTESRFPVARRGTTMPSFFDTWSDLVNRFMFPTFFERVGAMGVVAPCDVCERDNEYIVRCACAGCRPDDIDVTVENDVVRIRGRFMEHEMPSAGTAPTTSQQGTQQGPREVCLIRELPTGRFERDITLPTAINAQQAQASFENGLLTLTLPKAQAAMGHRIQIGRGAQQGAGSR